MNKIMQFDTPTEVVPNIECSSLQTDRHIAATEDDSTPKEYDLAQASGDEWSFSRI